ncbi:hypothetical protein B5X24_HaOG208154 [Helicoverpa armigera]|uniref:Uncharacterized protein n=1 Tax=Helicoverpa armigera TaxID=29058 RepID=A0A2W1BGK9_HELAM|nr:hypothetical protein B5X24_HaOG208154 [Helicoverpa armigera]
MTRGPVFGILQSCIWNWDGIIPRVQFSWSGTIGCVRCALAAQILCARYDIIKTLGGARAREILPYTRSIAHRTACARAACARAACPRCTHCPMSVGAMSPSDNHDVCTHVTTRG